MLNEIKETLKQHLRDKVPYVVEEKLDGSMSFVFLDPIDDKYKCATRGSFESEQAKIATEMFQESFYNVTDEEDRNKLYAVLKRYTPIFEVIYPENRFNDGARLVVDYGSEKTLILLAAINKTTGKDLDEDLLKEFGDILGFRLRKTYNYTIEELLELKKTLPATQEGFVVKFATGFRVKIKGDEYCRITKILNSISPISIWEKMKDNYEKNKEFELGLDYKSLIPEEIISEVNAIELKLLEDMYFLKKQSIALYERAILWADKNYPDNELKGLGLYTQTVEISNLASLVFSIHKNEVDKHIQGLIKLVRPKGNEL